MFRPILDTPIWHSLATVTAVLLGTTLLVGHVHASTYGGGAVLLRPAKKSPIQLKNLHLTMRLQPKTQRWLVETRYELRSRGAHDYTLDLLLPEVHCDSNVRSCRSETAGVFHKLTTTVDGVAIVAKTAVTSTDAKTTKTVETAKSGMPVVGPTVTKPAAGSKTWHFSVMVKAKKQVTITQRFEIERSSDRTGELVVIDFGPGRRWHGPIARLALAVSLQKRPWTVGYPASFHMSDYVTDMPSDGVLKGAATTHLRFNMRRLRPTEPLRIHLATAADVSPARRCPDLNAVANASNGKQKEATLKRMLVMRDLKELKRCRALYLALYGFPFGDKAKRARFYGKPVKSSRLTSTVLDGKRTFIRFGLRLNSSYLADLHPPLHQAYLDGLATEISRRRSH